MEVVVFELARFLPVQPTNQLGSRSKVTQFAVVMIMGFLVLEQVEPSDAHDLTCLIFTRIMERVSRKEKPHSFTIP